MKLLFVKKSHEGNDVWSFYFSPTQKLRYIAGQFIELTIPHNSDVCGSKRWFTISDSPYADLIRITTNIPVSQHSSYKKQLMSLVKGDEVSSSQPMGDFVLPKDHTIPLLFIAIGIGITPYISMINHLNDTNQTRRIKLIYCSKFGSAAPFADQLKRLTNINVELTTGHLTANDIYEQATALDKSSSLVYIAGPEKVVEILTKDLVKIGYDPKLVVTDYFSGI